MILVDTSVWIDHLRSSDAQLVANLESGRVLVHSFVIGEIALGSIRQMDQILEALTRLPAVIAASDDEILPFIQNKNLSGRGIGYVDTHLLASVCLTPGSSLWTRDKRLYATARDLGVSYSPMT